MEQISPKSVPTLTNESYQPFKQSWSLDALKSGMIVFLSKTIVTFVRFLNACDLKLTEHRHNPNLENFEDLGPISNAKNNSIYENSLLWALKKANTFNIAITGPYGSGKSSIIATFQRKHPEFRYLNVSLATFEQNFKDTPDWRQKVELSILQQLIYHEKNKTLPDSRFKKIDHTSNIEIISVTLFLVLLGICSFYIYKPDFIEKFSWWGRLNKEYKDLITYSTLGYFVLGFSVLVYKFYRNLKSLRFSKLGISSSELELSDKDDRSIFNKHLDEIIYFFQVTKYKVIVIEDLDRFDDAEIFTKLREVNNLINNSRQVGRKVKFIYAVRDDMFRDKDRAKFFDFIIPVIPVINTSNSGDKLGEKLEGVALSKSISRNFLNTITLYIQDMRLLINIINEFKVYLGQIGERLEPEKLLAIIIYKNLFPEDFANLHNRKGDVYKVFNSKKPYIEKLQLAYENELEVLEEEHDQLKSQLLKNVQELRSVYLAAIGKKMPAISAIRVKGVERSTAELLSDTLFDELVTDSQLSYTVWVQRNYSVESKIIGASFKQIEREVDPVHTYKERLGLLEKVSANRIGEIKREIANINLVVSRIKGYSLRTLMSKTKDYQLPANILEKPLLVYLVAGGFIDEHYPTYISYFIEGSLTHADMEFVRSVAQKDSLGFAHELKNVEMIVDQWLQIEHYSQAEVLNVTFLDWLLKENGREEILSAIFIMLANQADPSIAFIQHYLDHGKEKREFLRRTVEQWPNFWQFFYQRSLDWSVLDNYSLLLIEAISADQLKKLNDIKSFISYLSEKSDFITFASRIKNESKVKHLLKSFRVKVVQLNYEPEQHVLFDHIIVNQHYKLTPHNIHLIATAYGGDYSFGNQDELDRRNLTMIRNSAFQPLHDYISNNISDYVNDVMFMLPGNVEESEDTLIYLLNNEELDEAEKVRVISSQHTRLEDINNCPKKLWRPLIELGRVKSSWINIFNYFKLTENLTDELVNFLNNEEVISELLERDWQGISEDEHGDIAELAKSLEFRLLECDDLIQSVYELIADQAYYNYEELEIDKLSKEKVQYLIVQTKRLSFNTHFIKLLIQHHPDLVLKFVLPYSDEFLEMENAPFLKEQHYIAIIEGDKHNPETKLSFLQLLSPTYLNGKYDLCETIAGMVLNNQVPFITFRAGFWNSIVRNTIKMRLKIGMVLWLNADISKDQTLQIITEFPEPYNKLAAISPSPVLLDNTPQNIALINCLKSKLDHIISSFSIDKKEEKLKVNFRKR